MPETINNMSVRAIATLAFQAFVKSGAGELAKNFTAEAIANLNFRSIEPKESHQSTTY